MSENMEELQDNSSISKETTLKRFEEKLKERLILSTYTNHDINVMTSQDNFNMDNILFLINDYIEHFSTQRNKIKISSYSEEDKRIILENNSNAFVLNVKTVESQNQFDVVL